MDYEHLPSLQDLCYPGCLIAITSSISINNVLSFRRQIPWYVKHNSIRFVLDAFICDHFIDISQTDQILSLDEQEMHWLFDNQEIRASEATMLHCLLRWYQHQPADREKVFKDLFSEIHLSMIPKEYLWSVINKYDLINVMPELVEYKQSKPVETGGLSQSSDTLYDQNLVNIAVLGCKKEGPEDPTFEWDLERYEYRIECVLPFSPLQKPTVFNILGLDSSLLADFYEENIGFISVLSRQNFFIWHYHVLGHEGVQVPMGICIPLDKKEFSRCAPVPRVFAYRPLTVACGMYIFFLGCNTNTLRPDHRLVYRYDTVNDEWKQMASTIHVHDIQPSIIVPYSDRYIFVFDRQHGEKYDIYTNKWSSVEPKLPRKEPIHCFGGIGCQFGERIIFLLDTTRDDRFIKMSSTIYLYDPLSDTWEELKSLHHPDGTIVDFHVRHLFSYCGKIFVLVLDNPLRILEIKLGDREIKQLCTFNVLNDVISIARLSRGARVFMEHNQSIQYGTSTPHVLYDSDDQDIGND